MSKELFFDMKAEELSHQIYHHSFSKKKAVETGERLADEIFAKGETDPLRVLSNLVRLKAVVDTADKAIRDRLELPASDSWNGVSFTPKNGAQRLNYSEDPAYAELERKIKEREALLKVAAKSTELIFDNEGCEVPKVSMTFSKPSITVTF